MPARHDIANHDDVGRWIELRCCKAFDYFHAERRELCAHRWIHIAIRTGDAMSRRFRDGRNTAHECAANAKNVNVHRSSPA